MAPKLVVKKRVLPISELVARAAAAAAQDDVVAVGAQGDVVAAGGADGVQAWTQNEISALYDGVERFRDKTNKWKCIIDDPELKAKFKSGRTGDQLRSKFMRLVARGDVVLVDDLALDGGAAAGQLVGGAAVGRTAAGQLCIGGAAAGQLGIDGAAAGSSGVGGAAAGPSGVGGAAAGPSGVGAGQLPFPAVDELLEKYASGVPVDDVVGGLCTVLEAIETVASTSSKIAEEAEEKAATTMGQLKDILKSL